jgi:hypothetical protein
LAPQGREAQIFATITISAGGIGAGGVGSEALAVLQNLQSRRMTNNGIPGLPFFWGEGAETVKKLRGEALRRRRDGGPVRR